MLLLPACQLLLSSLANKPRDLFVHALSSNRRHPLEVG